MSELEEKLSAVLNNPQMMQQIMALANGLGASQSEPDPQPEPGPNLDPGMLKNLAGLAAKGSVDSKEQALLRALSPYLSQSRVDKLERAMRAAKIAGAASTFLGSGGLQMLTGR